LYSCLVCLVSFLGNQKAKFWKEGRKGIFEKIGTSLKPGERRIWIHAASLGEFEQGRPLIEKIKQQYIGYKIFLTFFSPSGYEVRKNYGSADYIYYLPVDTPGNARRFLDLVKPEKVLFIKYEYWYNYLSELKKRNIPVYLCSAIFRENQVFFKWYGGWYKKVLLFFNHLFVQTEESQKLLSSIGITNVTVTGDTRFDRVYAIASQSVEIPEVKAFVGTGQCLVAGSTWEPDEDFLCRYINESVIPLKYIVAPHEIHTSHIERIEKLVHKNVIRYSVWKQEQRGEFDVLVIDNIGMLSSLYRYGQVAYIGGGFGKGIHNTLEAATFGLPVLFGPNHLKFREALDLIRINGAFAIHDYVGLKGKLDELFTNVNSMEMAGKEAATFVKQGVGATEKILTYIFG
jgi:3-deoxy-D-manno-octulosonic-acid transferase